MLKKKKLTRTESLKKKLPSRAFSNDILLANVNKSKTKWKFSKARINTAIDEVKRLYKKGKISKNKFNKLNKELDAAINNIGKEYKCKRNKKKLKKNPDNSKWSNTEILEFIEDKYGKLKRREIEIASKDYDSDDIEDVDFNGISRKKLLRKVRELSEWKDDDEMREIYNDNKKDIGFRQSFGVRVKHKKPSIYKDLERKGIQKIRKGIKETERLGARFDELLELDDLI